MIDARGPLNQTGIARAFDMNVRALSVFDQVAIVDHTELAGETLFVQTNGVGMETIAKDVTNFLASPRRIAYYVWETLNIPIGDLIALGHYTEIWTASRYCQQALEIGGFDSRMIPHAVERYSYNGNPEQVFKFLMMFDPDSRIKRKNPFLALQAFKEAFGDRKDVQLTIKSRGLLEEQVRELKDCAGDANVKLLNHELLKEQMSHLLSDHDALISLHQSEGFGLAVLEAMAHGMRVIYTDYSAPSEFAVGYPVEFDLKPSEDPFYASAMVAYPRLGSAVEQMKNALADGDVIRWKAFQKSLEYNFASLIGNVGNALHK